MKRVWVLALVLLGCDGIGRPIVGNKPIVDGGEDEQCDVTPACRSLRTVEPAAFVVEPERLRPPVHADCDADGVPDAADNCPGVPNEAQAARACGASHRNCERLRNGETNLEGADLRGCRIDEPIVAPPALSFRGADLSCASITLTATAPVDGSAHTLDVSGGKLEGTSLQVESGLAAVTVDLGRSELRNAFIRGSGGARLSVRESVLEAVTLALEPGGGVESSAPALEITECNVERSVVHEASGAWPGRVRVERSTVRDTTFDVAVLDLVGGLVQESSLGASELVALDVELTGSAVSARYGAFSMCDLRDVIFARCDDLHLMGGRLIDIDVPLCEPERFRVLEAEVIGANLAGGLWLIESRLASSVLGGGDASTTLTEGSELDAVTICDLGAAAFRGGELRCVKCDEHAFMDGTSVCLQGAHIFERGCPAIELAPECGPLEG